MQTTLHRETRLRVWHSGSKSYETIIQQRVVKNLPVLLNIQCSVAGGDDGLEYWRQKNAKGGVWLPERIEVSIGSGGVSVKELLDGSDEEDWHAEGEAGAVTITKKYRLISTVSYIKNHDDGKSVYTGHHIAHVYVDPTMKRKVKERQLKEVKALISEAEIEDVASEVGEKLTLQFQEGERPAEKGFAKKITMASQISLESLKEREALLESELAGDLVGGWMRWNSFQVKDVDSADARDFTQDWREPCLVVYREIDPTPEGKKSGLDALKSPDMIRLEEPGTLQIPQSVMSALAVNGVPQPIHIDRLPGKGDLVAIDTEFVVVEHEDSIITKDGEKHVNQDSRSALARVSIVDAQGRVLLDDYVLPQEPVLDYVTRFSGIVASDLDPSISSRHLINIRTAYLKLRLLIDRGVIFVGHGLVTDFKQLNVFVPATQIIDTVEIFHQPRARRIGLRFLLNYLLSHDVQGGEAHDSIDDARAALELYAKALELRKAGEFDKTLTKIYEQGRQCGWTVGLAEAGLK